MFKIRYEVATGKVNLITNSDEELAAPGCAYMTVAEPPKYDETKEHLYVKDGKIVARPAEMEK